MRRRVLLCLTLITMSACNGDRIGQPVDPSATPPVSDISDATHSGDGLASNPDFFFLPPMVKNPSGTVQWNPGAFNAALRPTVEICPSAATLESQVGTAACAPVLTLATNVSVADEHYQVNWKVPTSDTKYFRITVKVGSTRLGFADVATGASMTEVKNLATDEVIPLLDGRTLPIRFRIERYALCSTPGVGPCTSASGDISVAPLSVQTAGPEPSGVIVPLQTGTPSTPVTVTIQTCDDFRVAVTDGRGPVTDLPTFGICTRVRIDPALSGPLTVPALVYSCSIYETAVAAGVTGSAQAERLSLHELNEQAGTPTVRALPYAAPACPNATPTIVSLAPGLRHMLAALANGNLKSAGRQMVALLAPRPLYAARFIDLGGGGRTFLSDAGAGGGIARVTESISAPSEAAAVVVPDPLLVTQRDFQFALPTKMAPEATPLSQTVLPGAVLTVTLKLSDLGNGLVRGGRLHFSASPGSSVSATVIQMTPISGLATVSWTLNSVAGANSLTVTGDGIAADNSNGPRSGVDPFQPLHTHWGDGSDSPTSFPLGTGSITFTATGLNPTGTISGALIDAFTGGGIGGATITATSSPSGMATDAIELAAISTTTAANGSFVIPNLPAGTYDVTTSAAGYVGVTRSGVNVIAGANAALGTLSTVPTARANELRVVLEWGACGAGLLAPCDLDSHLTGPRSSGARFHVFYPSVFRSFSETIETTAGPVTTSATLDVDDTNGSGPETITLTNQVAGQYRYYVHNYSGRAGGTPLLIQSGARVRVFRGATEIASFTVPTSWGGTGNPTFWEVFSLDGETLTAVNQLRLTEPTGLAPSAVVSRTATTASTTSSDEDLQRVANDIAAAAKGP